MKFAFIHVEKALYPLVVLCCVLGEPACKSEASGRIRPGQKIPVYAAIVSAEAHKVLPMPPTDGLGDGDGLRQREAGLRLRQATEAAQSYVRRAIIQRNVIRYRNPRGRRHIVRRVSEEVRCLRIAAVPPRAEHAHHAMVANRVAGLKSMRIRGSPAAQLRKDVHQV